MNVIQWILDKTKPKNVFLLHGVWIIDHGFDEKEGVYVYQQIEPIFIFWIKPKRVFYTARKLGE